jgi:hypothetical protein
MKRLVTFLLLLAIQCAVSVAQDRLRLQPIRTIPVAGENTNLRIGPVRCDADQNVYFQVPQTRPVIASGPVVKVSHDGKRTVRYSLSTVTDFVSTGTADFSVSDSDIYVLTQDKSGRPRIVKFDRDGTVDSVVKLDTVDVVPRQLGVFASGEYFVAGYLTIGTNSAVRSFAGLFGHGGQLLRAPSLAGDINGPKSNDNSHESQEQYATSLDMSLVAGEDQGNLYFARLSSGGPVFEVAPSGVITRMYRPVPPAKKAEMNAIKVAGGRMAVVYLEQDPKTTVMAKVLIDVYDLQTGEIIRKYEHQDPKIGVSLACYKPEQFTFITADEQGHTMLVEAGL